MRETIKIINKRLGVEEFTNDFYRLIRNEVFHFTSREKLSQILDSEAILTSSNPELKRTSIYSEESVGKYLDAVCLFDLRGKSDEQVAPGKSYYDFLPLESSRKGLAYCVISHRYYKDLTTVDELDDVAKGEKMYLPVIESWHKGELSIGKLECIYVIDLIS